MGPVSRHRYRLSRVLRHMFAGLALAAVALSLGGCSKCGFFWDDLGSKPASCHSVAPR